MGFKIKQLGTPWRAFTANVGPLNLTAGVPIAELYMGFYAVCDKTAGVDLNVALTAIDEVTVTRRGETIVAIENGLDLLALELFPWFDHNIMYTTGGSSGHYEYVKGLTLPCAYPVGVSGEFQITVEQLDTNLSSEVLSIAEGQGYYAHNYFGQEMITGKHFHIVKRLYDPAAAGWNSGFDVGTEGDLIGLLIWQTNEEGEEIVKTAVDIEQLRLEIGGETVVYADLLTLPGRTGARGTGQSGTKDQTEANAKAAVFDQYICLDFARQPWDCRGKTVVLSTDAGSSHAAIRAYPIYLIDE